MEGRRYMYAYDDNYKILAHYIVGTYRPADVLRCLTDNAYLCSLVQKETRLADIGGSFLDCIIEDILAKKKRMEYMNQLDQLAKYYASYLDKPRLRKEIQLALAELGVIVELEESR